VRAALRGPGERFLCERSLPVTAAGLRELRALLGHHVAEPARALVVLEATGVLHLHWAAALTRAGYTVLVLNPLMARRLHTVKNSIRDNKTDPVDARALCAIGALHGADLIEKYRFLLRPAQLALQRLHTVRKALRNALTNLKKTYGSLLELSFPELDRLLEIDGAGIRALLAEAPTPQAIARKRLGTLQKDWRLRGKAAELRALAADSMADPDLAEANAPALQAILQSLAAVEAQLQAVDQQIERLTTQSIDPKHQKLIQTIPGFGPIIGARVLAYLPAELLSSGNRRTAATRLQAFMGNDPRLQQSGQWTGQIKMSKRGVEMLRTAFFQAAFSAAQHDPELKAFYQRKRTEGKRHEVALSHLMRILTRRLVAVLRSQQPYRPKEVFLKNAA
jgi:transposase